MHELLRYLRGGYTVEQFVEDHPSAERHRVVAFLADAVESRQAAAVDWRSMARMRDRLIDGY